MLNLGAKVSKLDPAVFFWSGEGCLRGLLACHVDDFLWAGDVNFEKEIMTKVFCHFSMVAERG
jgi:hypothetical protein